MAREAATLDPRAHLASKLKARESALKAIVSGLDVLAGELDGILADRAR